MFLAINTTKILVEVFTMLVMILVVLGTIWLTIKGSNFIDRKAAKRHARRSSRTINSR